MIELKSTMIDLDRRIEENHQRIKAVFADQERQRENLKALGDSQQERGLRERYVNELTDAEERLLELRGEIDTWTREHRNLEKDLKKRLQGVKYEAVL